MRDQRLIEKKETEFIGEASHSSRLKGFASTPITPGGCVQGELTLTDIELSDTTLVDFYTLQWPGGDLSVTLDSSAFDEYLTVYQPPGYPTGTAVPVNRSSSAPEVFELEDAPAGTYTIWANSFVRSLGTYELCVSQSDATPTATSTTTPTSLNSPTPSASPTLEPTPSPTPSPTPTTPSGCALPEVPSAPDPDSGAIRIPTGVTLSWNGASQKSGTQMAGRPLPKVIYGKDNRLEVYEIGDPALRAVAESSVVIVSLSGGLTDNGDGTYTLDAMTFNDWVESDPSIGKPLCSDEPYRDQPAPGLCSGFLAAPDLVVTAGGCVADECEDTAFVFGFHMLDASSPNLTVSAEDVYFCAEVIANVETSGADYSIIRLDREVVGRAPLAIRRSGVIGAGQELVVVGHPYGLPTKIAGGAAVRNNSNPAYFVANLDTYLASAGSPVLNADTLVVEGVMVRGEDDFNTSGACVRSKVCANNGCVGEDCTRTTQFSSQIPPLAVYDVYFGPRGNLELKGTTDGMEWTVSGLTGNRDYCWQVVARNSCGEAQGPLWGFKTSGVATVCDSGYYLLDSFGARHRVGEPESITGRLYFGYDIARDMERTECPQKGLTGKEGLAVLDGLGAVHFLGDNPCDIRQDFYFGQDSLAFPQGRAVDLEMTRDSQGFFVLTDYGGIYRAGSARPSGGSSLLPGSDRTGVLGFDIPLAGDLRRDGYPEPGGATLRAISLAVIEAESQGAPEGFIVLDSMGGRLHLDFQGNPIPPGAFSSLEINDPGRLLDPTAYAWPFFQGLDIARDVELHPTRQGAVLLDGWDGIHPVPVNVGSNPVFFARNANSENDNGARSNTGMPYVNRGFDDPATSGQDEGDSGVYGSDAYSVFVDLDFSAGCGDGLYTLDRFGGVFTLGAARRNDTDPAASFGGSPYFFPNLLARDLEIFSFGERETELKNR